MNTTERRQLPRANPADVQSIVDAWKKKFPALAKDKGEFRVWVFRTVQHWFPPNGPFDAGSWSAQDIEACRKALETP